MLNLLRIPRDLARRAWLVLAPHVRSAAFWRSALALGSLALMSVGFWLAWPPLGLIVPGGIVFGLLLYSHLTTGGPPDHA